MKKITKIFGILLILGLAFAGFAGAASAEEVSISAITISTDLSSDTNYGTTTTCNLSVTANPTVSVTSGNVSWNGNIATITITLPTNNNSYTLASNYTVTATGKESASASISGTTLTLTVRYPVNIGDINLSITDPQSGYVPSSTVTIDNANKDQITATVSWGNTPVFLPGTTYTATITINAKSGYRFPTNLGTITINNKTQTGTRNSASQVTVTITYQALSEKAKINSVDITDITLPTAGMSTTGSVSAKAKMTTTGNYVCSNSTVTGTWKTSSGNSVTKFDKNTSYTLSFELSTPNDNYEFTSSTTATINSESATTNLSNTKLQVSKTYEVDNKIKLIDVTVTAPSTGVAQGSATAKGNTSIVISSPTTTWYEGTSTTAMTSGSTYKANTEYKAVIVVPGAPSGYVYADSPTINLNGTTLTSTSYKKNTDGTYTITYTFDKTGKTKIATINITNLESPVVGSSPDTSATATGYASGSTTSISLPTPTVKWYLSSTEQTSVFEAEKAYTVNITLTPTSDTEFLTTTTPTVKLNGTALSSSEITVTSATSITIKHTYDKTNGTISAVTLNFTEPAIDTTMNSTVTVSSSTPSNSISSASIVWNPSGTKFAGGNTYTATITVYAKTGYTFATYPTVKLNNTSCPNSEIKLSNSNQTMTITHTYSKLATPITSVAIKMDEPVAGKKAKTTPTSITSTPSSSLQATISWSPSIPESGEFDEETEYKATITVTNTNSDYAFTSGTTATINGEPATVSSPKATTMTVTYTFDKTNKKGIFSLPIGDEVATIPYPKDFFSELVALFQAIFNFDNWKLFG